jgi:hypothetical protein
MKTMKTLDDVSLAGLLALAALCAACSGGREHAPPGGGEIENPNPHPTQQGPQQEPVDSGVTAPSLHDASTTAAYPIFDGSTTPTSEYVRGVDAAAGEGVRGTADPVDAGPDAQ